MYVCASVLANKDANCTVLEYKLITFHAGFKTVNSRYVFPVATGGIDQALQSWQSITICEDMLPAGIAVVVTSGGANVCRFFFWFCSIHDICVS